MESVSSGARMIRHDEETRPINKACAKSSRPSALVQRRLSTRDLSEEKNRATTKFKLKGPL